MQNNTNNDFLTPYVSKLIDACKKYKKPLFISVIALVVVFGGLSLYCSHQEKVRQNSWAQYYNAQVVLMSQGDQAGIAAIDALVAAYPDTDAAYYGRLLQADALFAQENYAQALPVYETLTKAKNKHVREIATLSLGAAQQAVKDYAASILTLQNFIANHPTSFALPQAYFTLALSQELSEDKAAALSTYKKILEDYTKTYFGVFAKDKITQLSK